MAKINVRSALKAVQNELKAPKNQYNSFGKYKYRSCEDILQAARPLCNSNGLILTITDNIEMIGNRFYIKATVRVTEEESGESVETTAYAREDEQKKGMDSSQLTGSCSSYARKYALCGLFAIDDNKDADSMENGSGEQKKQNPNTYTNKAQKQAQNGAQDATTANNNPTVDELARKLIAVAKQENLSDENISVMIHERFGKSKWKDLSYNEKADLANNTLAIWSSVLKNMGAA